MPLREDCSDEALQQNTATEIRAGKEPDQAYAVAHDVMRRACRAAGRPMPKKACTQEYLEAALESAKQLLPAWSYAMIHAAALPKAGGRVRARMRKLQARARVAEQPQLLKTATEKQRAELLSGSEIKKGLETGTGEAGIHVHGIDRVANVTQTDGAHTHCFKLPGGQFLFTNEDGEHAHNVGSGQDAHDVEKTITDGVHSHIVYLDGMDVALRTSVDGPHMHAAQLETTALDGLHVHTLTLPDGITVTSMNVADSLAELPVKPVGSKLPPASWFTNAINVARMQQMQIEYLAEQLEEESEDEQEESAYPLAMEVVGKHLGGLDVGFIDNENGFSVSAPDGFDCDEGEVVDVLGDQIIAKSKRLYPMSVEEAQTHVAKFEIRKKMARVVDWTGPQENASVVFLTAAPNELEAARGSSVVGADSEAFTVHYLEQLGLKREQVAVGSIAPHWMPDPIDTENIAPWLEKTRVRLKKHPKAVVIALGKTAKSVLGDLAVTWVPHPAVVRKSGDAGQVHRKLKRISLDAATLPVDTASKSAELRADILADAECEPGSRVVTVKSARDEAQIVYGVVLDPNMIDSQNDWAPPAEIQETAHGYLEKSRVVGLEHERRAQAKVVESFVEQYPTKADYQAAIEGRPHKITRRPFGNDYLNSGAWVLGVKLEDPEWQDFKTGKLTGFSMGGYSVKSPSDRSLMPRVEVIDLKPST